MNDAERLRHDPAMRWLKEQQARRAQKLQDDEQEARDILRQAGIDLERLGAIERRSADDLSVYLNDVRSKLIERPTTLVETFKARSLSPSIPNQKYSAPARPYAASVLVPDEKFAEGIPGERGNPWVLPYNPEDINIYQDLTGSGWGCGAGGKMPPVIYNVWYNFVPDQTSVWFLWAFLEFHGFYILRADDSWFNCKNAEVHAEVNVDVYQYFWHGRKNFNLIDRDEENIETNQLYDNSRYFDYLADLRAGDSTWVLVQISIQAFARGDGSYGEVNFFSGDANFIKPWVLIAGPNA